MTARLVAVTGATGFLGLHLVAGLFRAGAKIRILARRDPAHEFWDGIEYETVYGELADAAALARLVDGADAVVHAAGLIKARNRAAFLRANREGAAAVAQAVRVHAPSARFIHVSTLAARLPDVSDYAFSKRAGEEAVRAVYAGAEERLVIVRPPVLYGPWDMATLSVFQAAAMPFVPVLGRSRVTVLHVEDAAAALAGLAMDEWQPGLFALAGEDYSLAEISDMAMRAQGRHARLIQVPGFLLRAAGAASSVWGRLRGEAPVFSASKANEMLYPDWVVRAEEALGYQPRIGLEAGFAETIAWYRSRGHLAPGALPLDPTRGSAPGLPPGPEAPDPHS